MTSGKEDVDELTDFFTTCGLFSPDTTQDMMDLEVREYIFPVSSKGKSLAARLDVEMNGEKVSVYLQLLFQHLSVASSTKTDDARQESFAYELCS